MMKKEKTKPASISKCIPAMATATATKYQYTYSVKP